MNLDDTRDRLIHFQHAFESFVEALRAATMAEEESLEKLTQLWDDSFGREFSLRYDEIREPVADFMTSGAEKYGGFLDGQILALERYLDGGR